MLGDSVSYLSTGLWGLMPPDRSWLFGYVARGVMDLGDSVESFIMLQAATLLLFVLLSRFLFDSGLRGWVCFGLFGVLATTDPLVEIYTRFYMSDFLPAVLFLTFAQGAVCVLAARPGSGRVGAMQVALPAGLLIVSTTAIFLRIACAAEEILMLVIYLIVLLCRSRHDSNGLARRRLGSALMLITIPILGILSLAATNMVAYGDRFQHRPFVNRLSGVFLMGVFAPALQQSDFRAAGVPLDAATFSSFRSAEYSRRGNQVWDTSGPTIRLFLEDHFRATDPYDARVDSTCRALVIHAAERDPLAILRVAVISTSDYLVPAFWRLQFDEEMGQVSPLPRSLIDIVDQRSVDKINETTNRRQTLLLRSYRAVSGLYPFLLAFGGILALAAFCRRAYDCVDTVFGAAVLATLASAGLYSNFVIPRYVLGSVLASYVLVGRLLGRRLLWSSRRVRL